jgi:hypothetical protein
MLMADTKTGDPVAYLAFHLLILMSDSFTDERVKKMQKTSFLQASTKILSSTLKLAYLQF